MSHDAEWEKMGVRLRRENPRLYAKLFANKLVEEDVVAQPGQAATSTSDLGAYATFDRQGNMSKRRNDEDEPVKDFFNEDDQQAPVNPEDEETVWDPMVAERLGEILTQMLDSEDPDKFDLDAILDKDDEALFRRPVLEIGEVDEYDPETQYDDEWTDEDPEEDQSEPTGFEEQVSSYEWLVALSDRQELSQLPATKQYEEHREYIHDRLHLSVPHNIRLVEESADLSEALANEIEEQTKTVKPNTSELVARKRQQAHMMKRRAARMTTQRKRKQFRTDYKTLEGRVEKAALRQVKDRLSGGKRKYSGLSLSQKVSVDQKVKGQRAKIEQAKRRLMQTYRQKLQQRRAKKTNPSH